MSRYRAEKSRTIQPYIYFFHCEMRACNVVIFDFTSGWHSGNEQTTRYSAEEIQILQPYTIVKLHLYLQPIKLSLKSGNLIQRARLVRHSHLKLKPSILLEKTLKKLTT